MNQLAVHKDDADVLLKQKNQLDESVMDKYRTAGQITETGLKYAVSLINDMYHYKTTPLKPISEICLIVDSVLLKLLAKVYTKCEKNISIPTSFNINQIITNYSPEINDGELTYFNEGDLITINMGVSVDGYCSNVSHTICIYPPGDKPVGPLLGLKADAIVANHYCQQVVKALLGLSMTPEKMPQELQQQYQKVTGKLIKKVVNEIVGYYNCRVIPGSEIRVIRRFLMGQNELLQEKGYKGIKWDEEDQELMIMNKLQYQMPPVEKEEEDFTVQPGEVYQVELHIVSINDQQELGIVSLEEINEFTGLNHQQPEGQLKARPTIYMRDFIMNYQLKLRHARQLISKIDKSYSVFPFKLNYLIDQFPLKKPTEDIDQELAQLKQQLNDHRFGIQEIVNHNLINYKPIRIAKYVPIKHILLANCTQFKSLVNRDKIFKNSVEVSAKSSESSTVLIDPSHVELWLLSNNVPPIYCHLDFKMNVAWVEQLLGLVNSKFGIKMKPVNGLAVMNNSMALD